MNSSFLKKLCPLPDLEAEAFQLLDQIPAGRVTTYGDLARAMGDDRASASRWLGEILKNHNHQDGCNCHRVVRSNGEIGHYVSGVPAEKRLLLLAEGLKISDSGIVDLSDKYVDLHSLEPLRELKDFQLKLVDRYEEKSIAKSPRTIAGVDCAYPDKKTAVGAYCELDARSLELIYIKKISVPISFPYIPGYLTFRELPVLLTLLDDVQSERNLADVIFVDGNGRLHPWRAGIATCLGVLIEHPTLGIGKSLLCGSTNLEAVTPDSPQSVLHENELIGNAIQSKSGSKPVFVSSGQYLSLKDATSLALQSFRNHRVPEPIFFADRLTKQH